MGAERKGHKGPESRVVVSGACTCTHVPGKAAVPQTPGGGYTGNTVTGASVWYDPEALCSCVGYGWAEVGKLVALQTWLPCSGP